MSRGCRICPPRSHQRTKNAPVLISLLYLPAIVAVTKDLAHLFQQALGLGKIGDRVHNGLAMYKNTVLPGQSLMSNGVAWTFAIAVDACYRFVPPDKLGLRFIR